MAERKSGLKLLQRGIKLPINSTNPTNQINYTDQRNQINQIDQKNQRNQIN
jgi:hypothetical protein